jgi:hypothetical protein
MRADRVATFGERTHTVKVIEDRIRVLGIATIDRRFFQSLSASSILHPRIHQLCEHPCDRASDSPRRGRIQSVVLSLRRRLTTLFFHYVSCVLRGVQKVAEQTKYRLLSGLSCSAGWLYEVLALMPCVDVDRLEAFAAVNHDILGESQIRAEGYELWARRQLLIGDSDVQRHLSSLLNCDPGFFESVSNVPFKRIGFETGQIVGTKVKSDRLHANELRVNGSRRFPEGRDSGEKEHGNYG